MKKSVCAFLIAASVPFFSFADESVEQTLSAEPQQVMAYVNINRDDEERIAELMIGVGPAIAARIIAYRDENGPFASIDDLQKVKGIGAKTVEKNRYMLKL
ncbi:ComEA family DNA-binding protein [Gynuella sp.]|uniref:ComEA family DNA-binding protein n=1 Tax=Gynuella sp. TaxID=2969146 RepID=UPI003D0BA27A